MSNEFFFSHARTAFKFGLVALDLQPGDAILIPDYICSVLLHPLEQLGLEVQFYPLHDDLSPNWQQLERKVTNNSKALLMIHYFGQPQNIVKFRSFCNNFGLFLIEDNAHGHSGKYAGQLLGTFGDIGFTSPRKFSDLNSGGILYWNRKDLPSPEIPNLPEYHTKWTRKFINNTASRFPKVKRYLKKALQSCPSFEDPYAFQEPRIGDYLIDSASQRKFKNIDWDKTQMERRNAFDRWASFTRKSGLQSVFKALHMEVNPWCFPAYAENADEAVKWFQWGWKHGHHVYSWPSLPKEFIYNNNKSVLHRWERLVCFSTNSFEDLDSVNSSKKSYLNSL